MRFYDILHIVLTLTTSIARGEEKTSCYSDSKSPLEYVPLQSLPSIPESSPLVDIEKEAPYWNLSCPWEWSKYSCIHQGQQEKARIAFMYTRGISDSQCLLKPFDGVDVIRLLGTRKIVYIGDSLSRQMFISFVCMLHSTPGMIVMKDTIKWSSDWPCHNTKNCVKGGPHSGFVGGCVSFSHEEFSDVLLTACYNSAEKGLPIDNIIRKNTLLARHDIIIANIGVHMQKYDQLPHVHNVIKKWIPPTNYPILIYRETSPQHFKSLAGNGDFDAEFAAGLSNCTPTIELSHPTLSSPERELFPGKVPFLGVNPMASSIGYLHVGDGVTGSKNSYQDCTHWCMPGVPDIWNTALYNYLLAHLTVLESGGY